MDAEDEQAEDSPTVQAMGIGLARIEWARTLLDDILNSDRAQTEEYEDSVGVVRNEIGANLYHFMVTRGLYSATRCLQSVMPILKAGISSLPAEVVLRSALVASAKTLYLVMPEKQEKRESRMRQIYAADRSALDHATNKELKLLGLPFEENRPQGAGDSEIIRNVLDDLVAVGNCKCGAEGCPQYDLEAIRHRILRLWWLYSSVTHVNLWHLEKATEIAPSGDTTTTGDIGVAVHDLGWLYAQAVTRYARRYDMLEDGDYLRFGEDLKPLHHEGPQE